jgi:hypothetical protein
LGFICREASRTLQRWWILKGLPVFYCLIYCLTQLLLHRLSTLLAAVGVASKAMEINMTRLGPLVLPWSGAALPHRLKLFRLATQRRLATTLALAFSSTSLYCACPAHAFACHAPLL